MKLINKNSLIEEGNYYKQLVGFGIFFIVGVGIYSLLLVKAIGTEEFILSIIVYGIIVLLPFGYFLGFRKLKTVVKDMHKITANKFKIVERKVIDKQIVNNSSTTNDTQIIFSKDDGVWVGRKKSKEIKVGDTCYVVYLHGDENACAIYSARKNVLDDELRLFLEI